MKKGNSYGLSLTDQSLLQISFLQGGEKYIEQQS
jgi:hypothetical protein